MAQTEHMRGMYTVAKPIMQKLVRRTLFKKNTSYKSKISGKADLYMNINEHVKHELK